MDRSYKRSYKWIDHINGSMVLAMSFAIEIIGYGYWNRIGILDRIIEF